MSSLMQALNSRTDYLVERQGTVSSNIANASTPGYISKDMAFDSYLKAQNMPSVGMAKTREGHMAGKNIPSKALLTENYDNMKHNGNSVKLDEEMLKMNDIKLNFNLVNQLYLKHKQAYQLAVRGLR